MDDTTDFDRVASGLSDLGQQLHEELEWLAAMLKTRLTSYFASPSSHPLLPDEGPAAPILNRNNPWASLLQQYQLNDAERLILLLALTPLLRPALLDVLLTRNEVTQRGFSEFGGLAHSGNNFLPSVETAYFLLAGDELAARLACMLVLSPTQALQHSGLLDLSDTTESNNSGQQSLSASHKLITQLLPGFDSKRTPSHQLPARPLTTQLAWSDLVLPTQSLVQLEEIRHWLEHSPTLLYQWGLQSKIRPGYTALFYGPPGTGKTLSASLLGKLCQREVYRIDLSMMVSKYIGETEKNLARLFDLAEASGWILFFDEADALFGKRTRVDSAHDRYANQEVSYLLQRIEEYAGVAILASNLKNNIDEAFLRRFHAVIAFNLPQVSERLRIWQEAFPASCQLEPHLRLERIAEHYELAGGTIMNVVRYAAIKALARHSTLILEQDIEDGIQRELLKEGKAF